MAGSAFTAVAIARAKSLLEKWMVLEPREIDLEVIAAELNVVIVERENIGSAARLVSSGTSGIITLDKGLHEAGRKRFAVAHEIGHFLLHRARSPLKMCEESDFFEWHTDSTAEIEANAFAVELLMPAQLFKAQCQAGTPSLSRVSELAELFQTSLTATAIRFVELSRTPCALAVSQDNQVRWSSANQSFPYGLIRAGSRLNEHACAADFFAGRDMPPGPETVPGYVWLEDYETGKRCFLYEEVVPLRKYNTTLSLVWLGQDDNRPSEGVDPHFTPDGKRYRW
jgi:Zn-dependent peptidase ImmA (M78 family)